MKSPVTVVVVAHERFADAPRSLESIYAATSEPFDLVYVDAGSPPVVRDFLKAASLQHGFRLLREEHYLSPNEARCRGLAAVDTPYVVFADNDLLVSPGWLERLVNCAEETGADLVGPLYLQRAQGVDVIHMAGGEARIEQRNGGRYLFERHALSTAPTTALQGLRRGPTGLIEFHCALARTERLNVLGGLDPALLNAAEHIDLCLATHATGGSIYLEPTSTVTYLVQESLSRSDLLYFLLRWSDRWTRSSLEHFRDKWNLAVDDPFLREHRAWIANYRAQALVRWRYRLRRILGADRSAVLERRLEDQVVVLVERFFRARD